MTLTPDLEVERQQLGAVHHLADVLVRLVESQRLVSEQAVGGNQLGGLVLLPVQAAVEFGEEEVDLVRRLLFDGVKLKDLRAQTHLLPAFPAQVGAGPWAGPWADPGRTFMSCSRVWLQAPSLVMAKAVEMLMGDMKMLASGLLLAATCLYSARAKRPLALDSSHTRGLVDSGTGRAVGGSAASGSGLR